MKNDIYQAKFAFVRGVNKCKIVYRQLSVCNENVCFL
jgi:hypothetical protein